MRSLHRTAFHCRACGELTEIWKCDLCDKWIREECRECHLELKHNKIIPQFMTPQFGGHRGIYTDMDGNTANDSAVRALEDGWQAIEEKADGN